MLTWYTNSILAAIFFTAMFLCLKKLQNKYPIEVYLFYVWLGTSFYFVITSLRPNYNLTPDIIIILILIGIVNFIGNYAYNKSIRLQPNLGYTEAVSGIRVIILFVVSLFFIDHVIELRKIAALFLGIFGIILLQHSKSEQEKKKRWVTWALLSGIMLALMIIGNRYVNDKGISPELALSIWLIPATLLFLVTGILKGYSFKLSKSFELCLILLAIVFSIGGSICLFHAYEFAPNLAYPTIINNGRMILLYMISIVFFTKKIILKDILAILMILLCIILIS